MNEKTLISVSISCNDRSRLKELANEQETTVSGLISQWIRKADKKKIKEGVEDMKNIGYLPNEIQQTTYLASIAQSLAKIADVLEQNKKEE